MADKAVLFVLAVSDSGLRSTLSGQLTLAGVDLITAHEIDSAALRRSVRRPAILILDERTLEGHSAEWLDALVAEPYWRRILILCDKLSQPADRDGRLVYVDRSDARAIIAGMIPEWSIEDIA